MFSTKGWAMPVAGGVLAVCIAWGSRFLVGAIYSKTDAIELIQTFSRSGLYLGSALMTSSATILALMLTLLGFARRVDAEFDFEILTQIKRIGLFSTLTFCGSLLLMMLLTLPVGEFDGIPQSWFPTLYNVLVGLVGILTGLLITTVLLLFTTIRSVLAHLS